MKSARSLFKDTTVKSEVQGKGKGVGEVHPRTGHEGRKGE